MTSIELFEKNVDVTQGIIHVRTWLNSKSNLSPIVLIHDSLGSVEQWRDFPKQLAIKTNRTVIAYDRIGFGKSSARFDEPSINFIAEEAELFSSTLVNALALEKFVLLGHSVGGAMAVSIAARCGNSCQAVITEAAQAFVEPLTVSGISKAKANFSDPEQFAKLTRWHGDKAKWVLNAWTEVWLSKAFSEWSLDKELHQVTCPILAMHGNKDEYGTLSFPNRIATCSNGPTQKAILQCGHVPHREVPEEFLSTVANFLQSFK